MAYTWSCRTKYRARRSSECPSQCAGIFGALRFEHLPTGIKKSPYTELLAYGLTKILCGLTRRLAVHTLRLCRDAISGSSIRVALVLEVPAPGGTLW
jgi:hypothetical protein